MLALRKVILQKLGTTPSGGVGIPSYTPVCASVRLLFTLFLGKYSQRSRPSRGVSIGAGEEYRLRISLHSNDERLRALIRSIVGDLYTPSLVSGQKRGTEVDPESELVLWDCDSDHRPHLDGWDPESPVVFLVQRQHLARLQEELKGSRIGRAHV